MEDKIVEQYTRQAAKRHACKIDEQFWLVVKEKPWWMPLFVYRSVIKNLIEFQEWR